MKTSKILLVEGIAGVGKSTLIKKLAQNYVHEFGDRQFRSFLHLAQTHTYGPLVIGEDSNSLTVGKNVKHLNKVLDQIAWFAHTSEETAAINGDFRAKFYALVDTLHITHCFRPGVVKWKDVKQIDDRLEGLGCKLLFLQASEESIRERTIESRKETDFIKSYGKKFGKNLDEIHSYFVDEQRNMHETIKASHLTKKILDANKSVEDLSREAFDFWMTD